MQLDPKLQQWAESALAAKLTDARRLFGGGSRETFFVDFDRGGEAIGAVLRVETGSGAFSGTEISLQCEVAAYRALQDSGVPAPKLYAVADDGNALLMERVSGEAAWHRIPADQRRAVALDFARQIANLHNLDLQKLDLSGFTMPRNAAEHAHLDLQRWQRLYARHTAHDDPLAHFAFSWLRANAPAQVARTVLVQGDTGVGNFLAQDGRVTGLVDWEFSYIGDPHNDIAFVRMRNRGSDVGSAFDGWEEEYERHSGIRIDPATLLYYRIFVELRCVVTTAMSIHQGGGALGLAGYLKTRQQFRRYLAHWLAQALDVEEVAFTPGASRAQASTALFDRALGDLDRLVRPVLKEASAKVGANAVRILMQHLRLRDQFGDALAAADRTDRAQTFGDGEIDDGRLLDLADKAGTENDRAMLGYLLRVTQRDEVLWDFSLF
jgi:aminoglycoside phosphotransferase (APT) family kinase protein